MKTKNDLGKKAQRAHITRQAALQRAYTKKARWARKAVPSPVGEDRKALIEAFVAENGAKKLPFRHVRGASYGYREKYSKTVKTRKTDS